jgi:hypothetical protein
LTTHKQKRHQWNLIRSVVKARVDVEIEVAMHPDLLLHHTQQSNQCDHPLTASFTDTADTAQTQTQTQQDGGAGGEAGLSAAPDAASLNKTKFNLPLLAPHPVVMDHGHNHVQQKHAYVSGGGGQQTMARRSATKTGTATGAGTTANATGSGSASASTSNRTGAGAGTGDTLSYEDFKKQYASGCLSKKMHRSVRPFTPAENKKGLQEVKVERRWKVEVMITAAVAAAAAAPDEIQAMRCASQQQSAMLTKLYE